MTSRKKTIGIAYTAAGGAKILGALVQLAVLPIAATALGAESFGLLFTLAALASFPLVAMAGFSPAASVLIAKAKASKDHGKAGTYFWSLQYWSTVSGVFLSALAYLALVTFSLPGAADQNLSVVFLLFLLTNFITASIDGTRAAFGESHYSSFFAIVGSTVTLLLAISAADGASVSYFFVAIYLVPVFAQLFNLVLFLIQYREVIGIPRLDRAVRSDIRRVIENSLQAQTGIVLYLHGGVLILSTVLGTAPVAVVGAFIRVGILVHAMLLSLFTPVLPTITSAVARADKPWVRRAIYNLWLFAGVVLCAQAIVTAAFGDWISQNILGTGSIQHTGTFYVAMASFVFCYSTTHLLFLSRVSLVSVEIKGGKILAGAFLGLVTGLIAAPNNIGHFLAVQAVTLALFATLFYAWQTARHVFGE